MRGQRDPTGPTLREHAQSRDPRRIL